jgi:hypothetical protein
MQKQALKGNPSELDSSVVLEAGATNHAAELEGGRTSVVYELEGSLAEFGDGGAGKEKRSDGNGTMRQ